MIADCPELCRGISVPAIYFEGYPSDVGSNAQNARCPAVVRSQQGNEMREFYEVASGGMRCDTTEAIHKLLCFISVVLQSFSTPARY